jgi:hypothetical protein
MRITITFLTLFLVLTFSAKAQKSGVSEAELMRYTIATDSINKLTTQFSEVSLKLANDPKITSERQKQLAQTQGDSTKLAQIKATSYERTYLKRVNKQRTEETKKFREVYQSLITDYVGDNTYSKVKSQLKTDPKLKHRFDSITHTLQPKKP